VANEQNLHPGEYQLTQEEQKKGGIASGEARRKKRDIRLALEMLLEKEFKDRNGNTITGAEAIAAKQFEKAMKGDTKAFEVVRDTSGQKPTDKIEMKTDVDVVAASERLKKLFDRMKNDG
jgi:hypothetical protein